MTGPRVSRVSFLRVVMLSAVAAVLPWHGSSAQSTTELKARIDQLEQRIERLERDVLRPLPMMKPAPRPEAVLSDAIAAQDCPAPAVRLARAPLTICFSSKWKIPVWVGYTVSEDSLKGNARRTDDFRPDPGIDAKDQAALADYRGSGYDRGHMAPAAAFKASRAVMSNTFLMTNMAPQTPVLNRNVWRLLEDAVRDLALAKGPLWVFTGNTFTDKTTGRPAEPAETIGPGKVAVPTASYKAILYKGKDGQVRMLAISIPNWRGGLDRDFRSYVTSIDAIELATGIDFFAFLSNDLENALEAKVHPWPEPKTAAKK